MTAAMPQTDTVLVVDDTPESLRFLTDTLESSGISVLVSTSGEAALDLLEHVTPDLVLMDAVMPGMDGFETTRALKKRTSAAHVPVIFMTGLTESEHVVQALNAGGVDYLRKPIIVDELLARVRVHLANARIAQGSQYALDATGRSLVAIFPDGRLSWATPTAENLLQNIDPTWARHSEQLPLPLHTALTRMVQSQATPASVNKVELPDGRSIEATVVGQPRSGEYLIRINLIDLKADIACLQRHFNLTQREAEVLLWISYGKPNRVISEILMISPRTVNKHLEQVFEKLGVETRAAAAAFAVRVIST